MSIVAPPRVDDYRAQYSPLLRWCFAATLLAGGASSDGAAPRQGGSNAKP